MWPEQEGGDCLPQRERLRTISICARSPGVSCRGMDDNPAELGELDDLEAVYKGAPRGDAARHLATEALLSGYARLEPAPRDRGRLDGLVARAADHRRHRPNAAVLTPEGGLPGDRWTEATCKHGVDGQLTMMRTDVGRLIANGQDLGLFGDNLLVDLDLSAANLPTGTRLRIGQCVLEVTPAPHNGCKKYRARFGLDALKFIGHRSRRPDHLRGIYVKVVEPGEVRVGDEIQVSRPQD